jgi:transposase
MQLPTPHGPLELELEAFALPPTFPLVLPICRTLRLREVVDELCPMPHCAHVTHGQVVEFVVLHLLQSPQRLPLYKLEAWAAEHHVHELYDCAPGAFSDDRVGATLDALGDVIAAVETRVVTAALTQYRIAADQIHWDLTHVTFRGVHEGSALIQRGYGAGAVHEKQLQVSLHVTGEGGIPVRHQVLPGAAHQAPLAPDFVRDLQQRLPRSDLLIVSDRAGISYENIAAYRRAGARFVAPLQLSPEQRTALGAVPAADFAPLDYTSRRAPRERYSCYATTWELNPQQRHTPQPVAALFVYSTGKARHDAQQRDKQVERVQQRLAEIQGYLNRRRYVHADYTRTQLERAVPAALQSIVRTELSGPDGQLQLRWWVDEEQRRAAAATDGRYVLVYDVPDATPEDVFLLYKRQAIIEARFRHFHSDLSVHPIWLQRDTRIQALLLLFVLALIVYTLLELCAERVGLEGPHYFKMTARELLFVFGQVLLSQVHIRGQPPYRQLVLSAQQRRLIDRLRFPQPTAYLRVHP